MIERPLAHYIYHRGFESHTEWGPRTPDEAELVIKTAALFCRGIVISDSDLNNYDLFYNLINSCKSSLFRDALKRGFIRRAARSTDQGPVSQQSLFESFSSNSPARASCIPDYHPRYLDGVLEETEVEFPPFTWKLDELAGIFGTRLINELSIADLLPEARQVADRIIDYVGSFGDDYSELRGAVLEKKFVPKWSSSLEQKQVWQLVLRAYNGNVPLAFNGALVIAEPSYGDPSIIPAGPEATLDDRNLAVDYYLSLISNQTEDLFRVSYQQVAPQNCGEHWRLNLSRLLDLSLPQIEELREAASPDQYFYSRFRVLGGGQPSHGLTALAEYREEYWANLMRKGLVLTERADQTYRDQFYRYFLERRITREEDQLRDDENKLVLEFIGELTGVGWYIFGADLVSLLGRGDDIKKAKQNVGPIADQAKKDAGELDKFINGLKRPDFRVIEAVRDRVIGGT